MHLQLGHVADYVAQISENISELSESYQTNHENFAWYFWRFGQPDKVSGTFQVLFFMVAYLNFIIQDLEVYPHHNYHHRFNIFLKN